MQKIELEKYQLIKQIVKPINWWMEQLRKYFTHVHYVDGLVICKKG